MNDSQALLLFDNIYFGLVRPEILKAMSKFHDWPHDNIHRSAIVAEEAGELVRACLQHTYESGDPKHMQQEAVQTAAMGIRFLVELLADSTEGKSTP